MNDKLAIKNVQNYFHISKNANFDSPIARKVSADSTLLKANVVLEI